MAFKVKLDRVTDNDINEAKAEAATSGRYTGPTPPDGVYKAKVQGLSHKITKTGKDMIVALITLTGNEGEEEVYNGAPIFANYLLPVDPENKGYAIQITQLDSLMRALSKGTFTFNDFRDALNSDRIQMEEGKGKMGDKINQIGRLKLPSESTFEIKTKLSTYNDRTSAGLHYILDESWESSSSNGGEVDDDVAGLDSDDSVSAQSEGPADDLDDLLDI